MLIGQKERPPNLAASEVCPGEDPSPEYEEYDLDKHVGRFKLFDLDQT